MSNEEKEYRCAYKEIVTILDIFSEEIGDLIPNEKVEFYRSNMDENHVFEYDETKEIVEQNILYPTRCILANLFRDYIATEEDRAEILKEEQEELNQIEDEKRRKYNPDDIFKNNTNKENETSIKASQIKVEEIYTNTEMIVKDENVSWFIKIKNKIISFIEKILKR